MASVSAYSTTAFSALVWELEDGSVFGADPLEATVEESTTPGALDRAAKRIRDTVLPRLMKSLNPSDIELLRTAYIDDESDPLAPTLTTTSDQFKGFVVGPSIKNGVRSMTVEADLEVLIPASEVASAPDVDDAIRIDGVNYAIVEVRHIPRVPAAVAYRCGMRKALKGE